MTPMALQLRSAPPLLVGAALLVWGWQCQMLPYAVLMAALVETSVLVSWRWAITDKEFNTLSDFSGVVFFITVVYIFLNEGARGIFVILEIMPFILFPLLVTQKYSEAGVMKLSALLVSLRKLDPALTPEASRNTDISLPYFVACLLSASAGNQRTILFFVVVALLMAIALWSIRPRRYSAATWFITLVLALSTAYATQFGLRQLQASIEASFLGIFDQFMWRYRDPNRATTAIGSLGRLKLSDRIVLRVKTGSKLVKTMLLREASYSSFGHGIWSSQQSTFTVIDPDEDKSWRLTDIRDSEHEVTISTYMTREEAVIPLPHASNRIKNVAAIEIAKNSHGAVLMDMREGWVQYDVEFGEHIWGDAPPTDDDLFIIAYYQKDFEKLADKLQLASMPDAEKVHTVIRFFQDNFGYSLDRNQRYPRGRYMANFLFNDRKGHCEYFATATALLLRSVGIPTRYAVGYAVDEYSSLEGQYIARARHAHSWTLVYLDGQWTVVDTTPAAWAPEEADNASALEPLLDLWSWASYLWSMWQSEDAAEDEEQTNYLIWLLIPLIAFLAWRTYFRERIQRARVHSDKAPGVPISGADSSFYQLVELIESSRLPRKSDETFAQWLRRLDIEISSAELKEALMLHNRYRFDPHGISALEQSRLKTTVQHLLQHTETWFPAAPQAER